MGNNFVFVFTRLRTSTNKVYSSSKVYEFISAKEYKKINLFKLKKHMITVQVFNKSTFIFRYHKALFGFGLKSRKTKVIDPYFGFDVTTFTFSEKLKRQFSLNTDITARVVNLNTFKIVYKRHLGISRMIYNSSSFSKDRSLLIVERSKKVFHLFSSVQGFKLIKVLRCNFHIRRLFIQKRNIYFVHRARKQVAYFNLLSVRSMLKKKRVNFEQYRERNQAMDNLRKRSNLIFEKMTECVDSNKIQLDFKVQKPQVLFKNKKLTKGQKKINQLSKRLFNLEKSVYNGFSEKKFVYFIEANIRLLEEYLKKK